MRRLIRFLPLLLIIALALPVLAQTPTVTAEAIGQANLRVGIGTDTASVGQITNGTRYPVLAQTAEFPWLLLGDPTTAQPIGWVFRDLVTTSGSLSSVQAFALDSTWATLPNGVFVPGAWLIQNGRAANPAGTPTPVLLGTPLPETTSGATGNVPLATPTLMPTATLNAAVTGVVLGEINIRYGPGVEFPRLGVGRAGEAYEITGYHTQLPWVQIRYALSPNGFAWVQADLLEYTGDRFSLPAISQLQFNLPTLTPTPSVIQAATLLGNESVPLSPAFAALGDQLWNLMLARGFDPATSRLGTLYLLDLQTGEALSFGSDTAYSGMSLSKIAIMTEFFGMLDAPPDNSEAFEIAEAMVCSENTSTNDMLTLIGGGSPYVGASLVTQRMEGLGMDDSFIAAPYLPDDRITPEPVRLPTTDADQTATTPDTSNQMTVDELGGLLGSIYTCAMGEGGALLTAYPDDYTPSECRHMINTMSNNRINALIEMGVPEGTVVAHKHGWIDDTHGDAGIVITPGGAFVLVVAVHNPVWMDFGESFPLIAEISREVYNYYNPDAPMPAIREGEVSDACEQYALPLIDQLVQSDVSLPTPSAISP
jgi:uncharacterized protein YraI/beta-lactamase class A